MFGTTFGYIIAIYPGLSIDYLYNYAKQQQRIQGLSILKDEHTVVKGLSIRNVYLNHEIYILKLIMFKAKEAHM